MKKLLSIFLSVILSILFFSGCRSNTGNGKTTIVCTIFPQYDFIKNILGEKTDDYNLELLSHNGADFHSFEPTAADILKISDCDIFVYIGGESDKWVEKVLKNNQSGNRIDVKLTDVLGENIKTEEHTEGMETHSHGEDTETENDEHIWLSLTNAQIICKYLCDVIIQKDGESKGIYEKNLKEYTDKLKDLDGQYKSVVADAESDTIILADRHPFRYLFDDYGIKCFAAFPGCSTESDASFSTVLFLANKADELGVANICNIESSNGNISDTVIKNCKQPKGTVTLNSMQNISDKQIADGMTYLSIMEQNLSAIQTALILLH